MDNKRNVSQAVSIQSYSSTKFMFVITVVFFLLMTDIILTNLSFITSVAAGWQVSLFLVMIAIFGIGQFFILKFVRRMSKDSLTKNSALKTIDRTTMVIQHLLTAFFVFVALQVILSSH